MNLGLAVLLWFTSVSMPIPQAAMGAHTPGTGATFTYVNSQNGFGSGSGRTISYTPGATGRLLIIDFLTQAASATITCSDNGTGGGSTWANAVVDGSSLSGTTFGECYTCSSVASVTSVSFAATGSGASSQAEVREYSYTGGSCALDQHSTTATANSSSVTGGSITTLQANELISGLAVINAGGTTVTGTGGYTLRSAEGSLGTTINSLDKSVTVTGANAVTGSLGGSNVWYAMTISYD